MKKDPANVTRWKHQFGFAVGHADVEMGQRREGLDTLSRRKEDVMTILLQRLRQPTENKSQKEGGVKKKKPID